MPTWNSAAAAIAASVLLGLAGMPPAQAASPPSLSPARDAAQADMLDVAAIAPGITLEMRYASANNFTARPVPGYEAPRCLLLRPAAEALARVQARLHAQGQGLRLYDCYRPVRAVQAFVAWVHDPREQSRKALQYPDIDKSALIPDYIADRSGHSRGATVDLTLDDCRGGTCRPVDMGTDFDFFGPRAHTDAPGLDATQREHRRRLVAAMSAEGFVNYPMEWWHFTFQPEPTPDTAYDFPVK